MTTTSVTQYDSPIMGSAGDDFISVEQSISFQWVPNAGNSYVAFYSGLDWDTWEWSSTTTTGQSGADGTVTFDGVTSSEPFQSLPTSLDFRFTNGNSFSLPSWISSYPGYALPWSYDPTTGVLDPNNMYFSWDDWIGTFYTINEANFGTSHDGESTSDTEYGHWQLVPDIHNVNVFGGAGNDTILGGQGKELLFGGSGNDLIRASVGEDSLFGGSGNDALYGGIGQQTLDGGSGNDTIWGGTGGQLLMGGDGQDVIHAGSGPQTVMGGAGNDTLWGGSGAQFLDGGDGNDVIHAGSGNDTLSGGAGRDMFVFSIASGDHVISDFQPGQDSITMTSVFSSLHRVQDLLPDLSSDTQGDAVLTVGSDFSLVLQHITLGQVKAHPADFFRLSA